MFPPLLEREGFNFMSTNQTASYGLHLWEPGDDFLREEFNENFLALDDAVKQKCEVVFGSYTGNDTDERAIVLGFRPQAVILVNKYGFFEPPGGQGRVAGGVLFPGYYPTYAMTLTDSGFQVSDTNSGSYSPNSSSNSPYFYIAFK